MKILFLSQRFILPMDTGGKIRTGNILKELAKHHEITMISNVESPKDDPHLKSIERFCSRFLQVPWQETRRHTLKFYLKLAVQMFSRYPVSVLNTVSRDIQDALEQEWHNGDYDLLICDFVQSALLTKNIASPHTLLFQHNVEAQIAKRHVVQAGNPVTRLFWWLQWYKMDKYERNYIRKFGCVIAVSEQDREQFAGQGCKTAVSIPTGVDTDFFRPFEKQAIQQDTLVFCGSMDWLPNEDGILFFIAEVWPRIKAHRDNAKLVVVGRSPSPKLIHLAKNHEGIELTGWVEDTRPYLAGAGLFIVPLRIGGGTRMKIFEAMAMGKAVLSTSIGAEGLPVTDKVNIALADDGEEFADQACKLMEDPALAEQLGLRARAYVEANFAWPQIASVFEEHCRKAAKGQK